MLSFLVIVLTVLLIIDCLILGLLILIQLPKKEAGVGMAFGGGAADALFGAGSGTALSNLTKYTAGAFFVPVFTLAIAKTHEVHGSAASLKEQMEKQNSELPTAPSPSPSSQTAPPPSAASQQAFPIAVPSNAAPAATMPVPASTAPSNAPAAK